MQTFQRPWLLATLSVACAPIAQPVSSYRVLLHVQSDPGQALVGAKLLSGAQTVGVSDRDGLVQLTLQGDEGSSLSFRIECPSGFQSPSSPLSVVLRRSNRSDRPPEYTVSCPPLLRTIAVAVRTEHGANLPIVQLGREVARTDRSGTAHLLLKSAPEETLELGIDTSSNQALRPRNPSTRFRVGSSDDVFVYNQSFSVEAPKTRPAPRVKKESGPVRIQ